MRAQPIALAFPAAVLGAARVATYPDLKTSLEDRAYRLHHNASQNRTDAFCRVRERGDAWLGTVTAALPGPPGKLCGANVQRREPCSGWPWHLA